MKGDRRVAIGIVQMGMAVGVDDNLAKAERLVEKAAASGADIVCLPELFAWRYFPSTRDSDARPEKIPGKVSESLSRWAKRNKVILVGGSIFEAVGRKRYNTCLVFDRQGRVLSRYRKVHIPQDDHYYEKDYFSPGRGYAVARTDSGALSSLICFDQWYPEPARICALGGAQMIFYPTAIGWVKGIEPAEGDWKGAWESVQVGHAISNSVVVCTVNRVGREGGTSFWGGSFVSDQFGTVLCRAGEAEGVTVVECDLALGGMVEEGWGFRRNRVPGTYRPISDER